MRINPDINTCRLKKSYNYSRFGPVDKKHGVAAPCISIYIPDGGKTNVSTANSTFLRELVSTVRMIVGKLSVTGGWLCGSWCSFTHAFPLPTLTDETPKWY